jgi:Rad3-related DNA helicase
MMGIDCDILDYKCKRRPTNKETPYPAYFSILNNYTMYWQGPPGSPARCPYWEQKVDALNNFGVVHNFPYILTESNFIGEFTPREIMISDEGHNIETAIINFIKLPFSSWTLDTINKHLNEPKFSFTQTKLVEKYNQKKLTNADKLKLHTDWITQINARIPEAIDNIKAEALTALDQRDRFKREITEQKLTGKDKQDREKKIAGRMKRLEDLKEDQLQIESLRDNQIKFFLQDVAERLENWVVKEYYNQSGLIDKIEFQPIRANEYAWDKYLRLGKINVIMSATILDHRRMASDLGLDLKDIAYIEVPPVFPAENHNIFNLNVANFGYCEGETPKETMEFYKKVVERIDMLLDLYPTEKGIIHCTTYEWANAIQNFSKHQDRLLFHGTKDRIEKLEEHKNCSYGSVLVSPSMIEGINLNDDYSRFQLIIKVPFPDLSDVQISKRKQVDPASYPFKTAKDLIQGAGRSVRNHEDFADTFCLDLRIIGFSNRYPAWMKQYTRCVKPLSELKNLPRLEGKPELAKKLIEPIPRPKKEKKFFTKPKCPVK